jgi:hypothetical protein
MQNNEKGAIPLYNNRNCGQFLSESITEVKTKPDHYLKAYGIDKIALSLPFGDGFFYEKGKIPENWEKIDHTQKNREVVTKYFRNESGKYNATIQTFRGEDFLNISFNPSKSLHPYKLITDEHLVCNHIDAIQKELKTSNIEIELENAKVSRFDIAHNVILNNELRSYQSVLDTLQGKRQIKKQHDDSMYWGNKQHQFIIYNKYKELTDRNNIPTTLARAEMRLLNQKCVNSVFKNNMLSNLIEHESLYINKFNSYIRNNIFRDSKDNQLKLDFGEIYSIYENAHKEYGNKAYSVVLKSLGLLTLVNHKDGIENLKKVIEVFHNERTARRHITEINQLISIFKSDVDKINSKSHYFIKANQEIREKLIINQLKAA